MAQATTERLTHIGYVTLFGTTFAVFDDPGPSPDDGGTTRLMTREECEQRLKNQKDFGFPCEQTEKALQEWPYRRGCCG